MEMIGNKVEIAQKAVCLLIALVLVSGFVVQDAKGQTSSTGLVAYYSFDGDTKDHSGNGNHGTNHGATFTSGVSGNALEFSGIDDYVDVPDSNSLDLTTHFTLEAWVNPAAPMQDPAQGGVISKVGGDGGNNGFQFGITGGNSQIFCLFNAQGESWPTNSLFVPTTVSVNKWSYIVGTYDNNELRIYYNGVLVDSKTIGAKSVVNSASNLRISSDDNDNIFFNGIIDEVKIYNYALTASEIKANYNEIKIDITPTPTTPVTATPAPTPAPTATPTNIPTTKKCEGTSPYLYIEDRMMDKGTTVEIPVMMCNADNLANMDLTLNYDSSILKIKDIIKGSLNANAIFDWNEVSAGKLKISFASKEGVSGSGSIAVMKFEVIGNSGATSTITGTVSIAGKTDGSKISINVNPGKFTVGTSTISTGTSTLPDCDGSGILTGKHALASLQMAVEKRAVDMCYDYNKDGKVDSSDARFVLIEIVKRGGG